LDTLHYLSVMAEPLKNIYSESFIDNFLNSWKKFDSTLDIIKFKSVVFSNDWESLELKERMSRIVEGMECLLPDDFSKASPILLRLVRQIKLDGAKENSFEYMFIPEYVEKHGLDFFDLAMNSFEFITQFTSCEFAIRPYIIKYPEKSMQQMLLWSKHSHPNVRRFSSEGCRPRLPWAMALPAFKKDPSRILSMLENLKSDSSLFVRKSVANNLNDISKDNPETLIQIAYQWYGNHTDTNWIIKHACRTLLKAGNPEIMKLFGYANIKDLKVHKFVLKNSKVIMGENLEFEFEIENTSKSNALLRLEYGMHFLKKNGSRNLKVFKISERELDKNQRIKIQKNHPFKWISTRVYYEGIHQISLIINGITIGTKEFKLEL